MPIMTKIYSAGGGPDLSGMGGAAGGAAHSGGAATGPHIEEVD